MSSVLGIGNRRDDELSVRTEGLERTELGVCSGTSGCVFSRVHRTREPTSVAVLFRPAPAAKSSESHYRTVSRCPFSWTRCLTIIYTVEPLYATTL